MIREGEKQLPNLWSSVMYFVCMHVNVGVHFPLSIYSQLHFTVVSAQMHHQSNLSRAEVRGIVGHGTQLTSKDKDPIAGCCSFKVAMKKEARTVNKAAASNVCVHAFMCLKKRSVSVWPKEVMFAESHSKETTFE